MRASLWAGVPEVYITDNYALEACVDSKTPRGVTCHVHAGPLLLLDSYSEIYLLV